MGAGPQKSRTKGVVIHGAKRIRRTKERGTTEETLLVAFRLPISVDQQLPRSQNLHYPVVIQGVCGQVEVRLFRKRTVPFHPSKY